MVHLKAIFKIIGKAMINIKNDVITDVIKTCL